MQRCRPDRVPEALEGAEKQGLLIAEGVVDAGAPHAHRLTELVEAGVGESVCPKDLRGAVEHLGGVIGPRPTSQFRFFYHFAHKSYPLLYCTGAHKNRARESRRERPDRSGRKM